MLIFCSRIARKNYKNVKPWESFVQWILRTCSYCWRHNDVEREESEKNGTNLMLVYCFRKCWKFSFGTNWYAAHRIAKTHSAPQNKAIEYSFCMHFIKCFELCIFPEKDASELMGALFAKIIIVSITVTYRVTVQLWLRLYASNYDTSEACILCRMADVTLERKTINENRKKKRAEK